MSSVPFFLDLYTDFPYLSLTFPDDKMIMWIKGYGHRMMGMWISRSAGFR